MQADARFRLRTATICSSLWPLRRHVHAVLKVPPGTQPTYGSATLKLIHSVELTLHMGGLNGNMRVSVSLHLVARNRQPCRRRRLWVVPYHVHARAARLVSQQPAGL